MSTVAIYLTVALGLWFTVSLVSTGLFARAMWHRRKARRPARQITLPPEHQQKHDWELWKKEYRR